MAYLVDDLLATVKAGDGLAFANLWTKANLDILQERV